MGRFDSSNLFHCPDNRLNIYPVNAISIHEENDMTNIDSNCYAAYESGLAIDTCDPETLFNNYLQATFDGEFAPSVAASVCFAAGYMGRDFPEHDRRIYA